MITSSINIHSDSDSFNKVTTRHWIRNETEGITIEIVSTGRGDASITFFDLEAALALHHQLQVALQDAGKLPRASSVQKLVNIRY
jgi:hypothetical protein